MNCCRMPDVVRIVTEDEIAFMTGEGSEFCHKDAKVTFSEKEELQISFSALTSEVRFLVCRWQGSWDKGYRFLGDAFERGYGNLEWRGLNSERIMPWYFVASNGVESMGFGVKVRPDAFCFWMCDGEGISLWLDIRCGAKGVILGGKTLELATVVEDKAENTTAFRFLKEFCKKMCSDPITPRYPVYGSNNWYYAYGNTSAEQILIDTDLLAETTKGLENRPYMVIDDGWQELALISVGGAAGRPYERGNYRFPDMAGLAQEMKGKNVHPGLWIRPLKTSEKFLSMKLRSPRDKGVLDPSLPEVLELVAEDVERVVNWGYEMIKYDFVTKDILGTYYTECIPLLTDKGWSLQDRSKTTAQCIKDLYRTIYEHSREALLIGCNVVGHLAAGYIHIHRSGNDTSGEKYDQSIMMGVNALAFRLAQHKAFFDVDADCVCITDKIPWDRNRNLLELYAKSGTPLFVSASPDCMTEEIKAELRKAFTISSVQTQRMEPLDWMDTTLPERYLVDNEELRFRWIREHGNDWFYSY